MLTLTKEEHHLIKQAIFLPILIHVYENDRKRMLTSHLLLKTVYETFIDERIRQIRSELKEVKRLCYQKQLRVSFQGRIDDHVIFSCFYKGYTFDEKFTLSAIKAHLRDMF